MVYTLFLLIRSRFNSKIFISTQTHTLVQVRCISSAGVFVSEKENPFNTNVYLWYLSNGLTTENALNWYDDLLLYSVSCIRTHRFPYGLFATVSLYNFKNQCEKLKRHSVKIGSKSSTIILILFFIRIHREDGLRRCFHSVNLIIWTKNQIHVLLII